MAQAIGEATTLCPLCGGPVTLELKGARAQSAWRDVLDLRARWAEVAVEFRERRSVEEAARRLRLAPETVRRVLELICLELCGCRRVTCVSCLDDYRSEI